MSPSKNIRVVLDEASRRLEKRLFGVSVKPVANASASPDLMPGLRTAIKCLAALAGIACLGGFLYFVIYYQSTGKYIGQQPHVRKLSSADFVAHVRFGESPLCGADKHPCWVEPGFDDGAWQVVHLPLDPSSNLKGLKNYDVGLRSDSMYYRIRVPVAAELLKDPAEISFTPLSIQHHFFEFFINGRPVYSGNGTSVLGRIVNLPVRRADIRNGEAFIVLHGSVRPEDVGISHYFDMFVGPKSVLDNIYVFQERTYFTYYLLFLLSKGSVFIVFALFFIYTRGQRGMNFFLVYAFFTTFENLFVGEFLGEELSLRVRALLFHGSKTIATIGLLGFFASYFSMKKTRRWYLAVAGLLVSITLLMCLDFGWGTKSVGFSTMRMVNRSYLLGTLLFALVVGNLARRLWLRLDGKSERYRNLRSLCWLLAAFFAFDIWEYFFTDFGGFDKSAVLDLFLFYFVALISARDFGTKEGMIRTLEGHMREKFRMEQELQSAAEIARAFLPDRVPSWEPVNIDVFHRPLTENSGDWFAFERSADGTFYHFIMCDITGHGVQAAIVVSTCKTVLSSLVLANAKSLEAPDFIVQFATALNGTLFQNGHGLHVSTLLGVSFEPGKSLLHYFSAGHPLPLHISKGAGDDPAPKVLVARHNLLGIAAAYQGKMRQVAFLPGDELITFTDGLPASSHLKVLKKFLRSARGQPLTTQAANLYECIWEAETLKTSQPPNDDVSIVWFRGTEPPGAAIPLISSPEPEQPQAPPVPDRQSS